MKKIFALAVMLLTAFCVYSQVNPQVYYTFDLANPLAPTIGTTNFSPAGSYTVNTNGKVGKYVTLPRAVNQELRGQSVPLTNATSIEFLFKAEYGWDQNRDIYLISFGNMFVKLIWPEVWFYTTSALGADNFQLSLDQVGPQTWSYYKKGWHHLVFTYNATSGTKTIYVDGTSPSGFQKVVAGSTISNGSSQITLGLNTSFSSGTISLDEIAVYNQAISAGQVYKNYSDAMAGNHYTFGTTTPPAPPAVTALADSNEYPIGYVVGTNDNSTIPASQLQQLKTFPRPRYPIGSVAPPNFNWMGHKYMSGWFQPSYTNAMMIDTAAAIGLELSENWNYSFMVNSNFQSMDYSDTTKYEGKMVAVANRNKQYKTAIISFWKSINPSLYGYAYNGDYFRFQGCPNNNYIRNASGQFVNNSGAVSGTKYRSPASPIDSIKIDATTFRRNITALTNVLTDTLDYINENCEIITKFDTTVLNNDPAIVAAKIAAGFGDMREYLAYGYSNMWQIIMDSIRTIPKADSATITMYQVDGQDGSLPRVPYNRFNFQQYKKNNEDQIFGNTSTFDFYPRYVWNWRYNSGAWRGIQQLVEARAVEEKDTVKYFTPFIGAGWSGEEEKNLRPAQWLGLLKINCLLGARMFYTGYFNEASNYNPPNPPPYDPRGYIYQASTPSYAQSAAEWVMDNGYNDTLLAGDVPNSYQFNNFNAYRFYSGSEEIQTVVRKKHSINQYAIATAYVNSSNMAGTTPLTDTAVFTVNGKQISVETRRQGSVYMISFDGDSAVCIQYDDWHEYKHPQRWSSDFIIQAEHYGKYVKGEEDVRTIPYQASAGSSFNFVGDTTYLTWIDSASYSRDTLRYQFRTTSDTTLYLWVLMRSANGTTAGFTARMDNTTSYSQNNVVDTAWRWYRISIALDTMKWTSLSNGLHTIKILPTSARTMIDKFLLTPNASTVLPEGTPGSSTPCAGVIPQPTVTPSGPITQCGGTVTLSSSTASSYAWSNGLTTQNISIGTSGNYFVVTTDGAGCTASSDTVSVTINPAQTTSITSTANVYCGTNITLTSVATGASLLWSTGATTQSISVGAGTYTVTVTNASGCTGTASKTISSGGTLPTASIVPSGTIQQCDSNVTLSASGGTSYLWSTGATTSTISAGTGSYYVLATNASGCTDLSDTTIVSILSGITASVTPPSPSVCSDSAALTANPSGTYLWNTGATTKSISAIGGTYTVTVTSADGCTSQASSTVTINTPASASISPSGTVTQCGGTVSLTASAGSSYLWSNGATTQTISASNGNYTVIVTNSDGCSDTSSASSVIIYAVPSAFIVPTVSSLSACTGQPTTLSSSSGASYAWSNGATSQQITIYSSGTYSVTVTNANGCSATSSPITILYTGCSCDAVTGAYMSEVGRYAAIVNWTQATAATAYKVIITDQSDPTKTQTKYWSSGTLGIYFNQLKPQTLYKVSIYTICSSTESSPATLYFTTKSLIE